MALRFKENFFIVTIIKLKEPGDFPGDSVVKNPPSKAGEAGSISGQGAKIPDATGRAKKKQIKDPIVSLYPDSQELHRFAQYLNYPLSQRMMFEV